MSSRWLSFVLRHSPESIGIVLDSQGWVRVETLLTQARQHGKELSLHQLMNIVEQCPKKRFTLRCDDNQILWIRAAQGHSTAQVNIKHQVKIPPMPLYHGTARHSLPSIMREGLKPMRRDYVHLSVDRESAQKVGARHGKPIILEVNTITMMAEGYKFYQSDNGVWLTDRVPTHCISILE
ncbi:MAG: RNA 2'-phosphotransferase [Cardiobacteriaceae bacterium]|nr:RNA 2'-phosphotransferase [Cardiobacteriaceae bacterium]